MADRSILKISPLDSSRIDYGAFTATLAQEALRAGLLSDTDMNRIQEQLLALLRAQIQTVTRGESSSIPAEAADELMDGIGYCVDRALQSAASLDESAALLRTESIEALYRRGADQLNALARACEGLLARVRSTRVKTVNTGYNIALDDSFPQTLRSWKSNPHPHDFVMIAEFPPAVESGLSGIPELHARLTALALENRFCARFAGQLDALLVNYARQNHVSPADAYVNLFLMLLQNLLLCRLLGREDSVLYPEDLPVLRAGLEKLSAEQRGQLIQRAANELLNACGFENDRMDAYVYAVSSEFAASLNTETVEELAVVTRGENRLIHLDGVRLEDEAFRQVADEILLCTSAADKMQILRTELHSLSDLCDILSSDCLFGEEYSELFELFDDASCALLLTRMPYPAENGKLPLAGEFEWQLRFARFFNDLDAERSSKIIILLNSLSNPA